MDFQRHISRALALAAFALSVGPTVRPSDALSAQIDYRNLDDDRPVRVEDAYPAERYAFEFLIPYSVERERSGATLHASVLELEYGVIRNGQVGLKAPFGVLRAAGTTEAGLSGLRVFGLYNFNTESRLLPALSLRTDVAFPVGGLAGSETQVALKAIATRSWGRNRVHVNAAYRLGPDATPAVVEGLERWWYGAAVDRTLFRQSLLIVGETYARKLTDDAPVEVNASVGLRWQWRTTTVLDVGLSRRLRETGPDLALTVGISNVIGVRASGLGRRAPHLPEPRTPSPEPRAEQFYYPGSFNWAFLENYPEGARLFNAFDYGHAVLYETLYTRADSTAAARELEKQYRYLTTDLLVRPPRFAVAEEVIEPNYAKLAWRAKLMLDWAHVLHRQIYDAYADERIPEAQKDSLVERLTDYYLSRPDIAFVPVPKSMALMDEQYYSQVFRKRFPKFNGLIWAYHWLQVGLYEPFIAGRTPSERKAGVQAAVARFWDMLKAPPRSMPQVMPMTATVAPLFTERHPRAAAIFDNLHMMHDIISDILAADTVPREKKREVIYTALAEFRDTTRNVLTHDEWLMMGHHMGGIDAMGGPATGLLPGSAQPGGTEHRMPRMEHRP